MKGIEIKFREKRDIEHDNAVCKWLSSWNRLNKEVPLNHTECNSCQHSACYDNDCRTRMRYDEPFCKNRKSLLFYMDLIPEK